MQYLISFLEGIITFISPCLLPMLPIYITYFAGGGERSTRRTRWASPWSLWPWAPWRGRWAASSRATRPR